MKCLFIAFANTEVNDKDKIIAFFSSRIAIKEKSRNGLHDRPGSDIRLS